MQFDRSIRVGKLNRLTATTWAHTNPHSSDLHHRLRAVNTSLNTKYTKPQLPPKHVCTSTEYSCLWNSIYRCENITRNKARNESFACQLPLAIIFSRKNKKILRSRFSIIQTLIPLLKMFGPHDWQKYVYRRICIWMWYMVVKANTIIQNNFETL